MLVAEHSSLESELGALDLNLATIYATQMIQGLAFMHENRVIHRDLKPANVLISVEGRVKLADFGTAFDLSVLTHTVAQTICGTPAFVAPEVILKDKHTTATDIWSMGVIVFNMIEGSIPFKARDKYALLHKIAAKSVKVNFTSKFTNVFREIIESCLMFEPELRPTASQLLEKFTSLDLPALMSESSESSCASVNEQPVTVIQEIQKSSTILSLQEISQQGPTSITIHGSA